MTQEEPVPYVSPRAKARKGRRKEPRIVELATHPRQHVCLRVAAEYLGLDERTVRARVEEGKLEALRDGHKYQIGLPALVRYVRERDAWLGAQSGH